jgi:Ribbon-helix-helix protein, copG family
MDPPRRGIITRIDALAKRRGVTREDVLRRLLEQPGSEERGEDAGEPPETAR